MDEPTNQVHAAATAATAGKSDSDALFVIVKLGAT